MAMPEWRSLGCACVVCSIGLLCSWAVSRASLFVRVCVIVRLCLCECARAGLKDLCSASRRSPPFSKMAAASLVVWLALLALANRAMGQWSSSSQAPETSTTVNFTTTTPPSSAPANPDADDEFEVVRSCAPPCSQKASKYDSLPLNRSRWRCKGAELERHRQQRARLRDCADCRGHGRAGPGRRRRRRHADAR